MPLSGVRNEHYYRHLRNQKVYRMLFTGLDTKDGSEVVIYRACYGEHKICVRDKAEFCDGRFEYIGDLLDLKAAKYGV